jgi:hypothetical protein
MKILLIGEFSGVHNNLKKGLVRLGHNVKLAADGDGFKKFSSDIRLTPFKGKYLGRLLNVIYFVLILHKLTGYDVVQFISPYSIKTYIYKLGLFKFLLISNKSSIYYSCGTDPNYLKVREQLNYFPFDESEKYTKRRIDFHNWFIKNVDVIVPATYSYAVGYKNNPKRTAPIKLPGSGIYVKPVLRNGEKKKILVGITRKEFKGMEFILPAVSKLKKILKDRVEVNIVEKLPFKEYEQLLEEYDIIIDQCKSYSYGMNAIFSMERGLVVLSGNEGESADYLGVPNDIVINIKPSINDIYEKLKSLVLLTDEELNKVRLRSIELVKQHHNPDIIAKEFVELYTEL